jgi:hypothetical protein
MAGVGRVSQVGARVPQVGERMQVGRMLSRLVRECQSGADGDKKHEYGAMSYSFHSLLINCFWLCLSAETCFLGSKPERVGFDSRQF